MGARLGRSALDDFGDGHLGQRIHRRVVDHPPAAGGRQPLLNQRRRQLRRRRQARRHRQRLLLLVETTGSWFPYSHHVYVQVHLFELESRLYERC